MFALTRPNLIQGGALGVGMRDAVKLACRLQRHGGGAVAGDSGAIGMTAQTRDCAQRHFVGHLLPAQGLGVPCATGINDRRVTHKVCWVNVPAASPHANPVSGAASIIRRVTLFPGTVAIARCQFSGCPAEQRSGMPFGFWEQGNPKTAGRGAVLMGYRTNLNGATSPGCFGSVALWNGACAVED